MENLNIEIVLTLPQHLQKLILTGADAVIYHNVDEADAVHWSEVFELGRSPEFLELCEEIVKKLTPP